ncbi:MAG: acylphosphatase [Deltaproteobacteria bacterium]
MNKVRARIIVEGLVQGVYYRANTTEVSKKHGVCGWVKNNPDGTVEAVLEGEKEDVELVISWCRVGPMRARVDSVDVKWEEFRDEFDDFTALTRHNSY